MLKIVLVGYLMLNQLIHKMAVFLVERDPTKRKVKPAQALFDFDDLGESSDDSDFRIEDHCEESDDDSLCSDDNGQSNQTNFIMFCMAICIFFPKVL